MKNNIKLIVYYDNKKFIVLVAMSASIQTLMQEICDIYSSLYGPLPASIVRLQDKTCNDVPAKYAVEDMFVDNDQVFCIVDGMSVQYQHQRKLQPTTKPTPLPLPKINSNSNLNNINN